MASETIYGYFGQKGAGKTHELVRIILQRLREGRRVVAVMPQLDVDKVARYLGDPTVKDRLIVADYTDVTANPKFFPDEHVVRALQLWKRFDIDYAVSEPEPDSPRSAPPAQATSWRDSVVIPGDLVIIDEAWRWLESAKDIPKALKSALHMARHWHGPLDWRGAEAVEKYSSPDWFPGLGGPEWVEAWEEQPVLDASGEATGRTKKVKVRKFKGGDGTRMVTTNILFASQDFFGLARNLRGQIDQTTLLVSVRDSYFPMLLQKATDGKEQYKAYTFEAADMPTRRQMLAGLERNEKLWLAEQTITHSDEIHSLYEYATGYAQEKRADNKSDLSNNPHWKKIKRGGFVMLFLLVGSIGLGLFAWSRMGTSNDLVANTAHGTGAPRVGVESRSGETLSSADRPATSGTGASRTASSQVVVDFAPVFEGRVGGYLAFRSAGRSSFALVGDATPLEQGWRVDVGGHSVETAAAMATADPEPVERGTPSPTPSRADRDVVDHATGSLSDRAAQEAVKAGVRS